VSGVALLLDPHWNCRQFESGWTITLSGSSFNLPSSN
jgi:hypothetical protein